MNAAANLLFQWANTELKKIYQKTFAMAEQEIGDGSPRV